MSHSPPRHLSRRAGIVAAVIGMHGLGLWAMQSGLLVRAVELIIPVQLVADLIEAPQPEIVPAPPPPPPPRPVVQQPKPRPAPAPPPVPIAIADPTPVPEAPVGVIAPPPAPIVEEPPVVVEAPAPPAPPPRIELPSSNADYLNNPPPPYPALSRRLGEQGSVVVRVFIDTQGAATRAEIRRSSGYERLDQTALQTVQRWRYVPGRRNGVPEAMWFNVPINFVLE